MLHREEWNNRPKIRWEVWGCVCIGVFVYALLPFNSKILWLVTKGY